MSWRWCFDKQKISNSFRASGKQQWNTNCSYQTKGELSGNLSRRNVQKSANATHSHSNRIEYTKSVLWRWQVGGVLISYYEHHSRARVIVPSCEVEAGTAETQQQWTFIDCFLPFNDGREREGNDWDQNKSNKFFSESGAEVVKRRKCQQHRIMSRTNMKVERNFWIQLHSASSFPIKNLLK